MRKRYTHRFSDLNNNISKKGKSLVPRLIIFSVSTQHKTQNNSQNSIWFLFFFICFFFLSPNSPQLTKNPGFSIIFQGGPRGKPLSTPSLTSEASAAPLDEFTFEASVDLVETGKMGIRSFPFQKKVYIYMYICIYIKYIMIHVSNRFIWYDILWYIMIYYILYQKDNHSEFWNASHRINRNQSNRINHNQIEQIK